jgi:hypothetical protein
MAIKRLVRRFKIVVRLICGVEGFCDGDVMPIVAAAYDSIVFRDEGGGGDGGRRSGWWVIFFDVMFRVYVESLVEFRVDF